ncbi:MAG: hypothetical protein LH629_14075 [Ignavibacteria bacterium]|nr:hypothetical protein [Ignavibacteria bacterium]
MTKLFKDFYKLQETIKKEITIKLITSFPKVAKNDYRIKINFINAISGGAFDISPEDEKMLRIKIDLTTLNKNSISMEDWILNNKFKYRNLTVSNGCWKSYKFEMDFIL